MNKKKAKTKEQILKEKIEELKLHTEHIEKENKKLHRQVADEIGNCAKQRKLRETAEKDRDDWKFIAMSSSALIAKLSKSKYPIPVFFTP